MPKFAVSFTCVLSVGLALFAVMRDQEAPARRRPGDTAKPVRLYGFPDPRGVVLMMRQQPGVACAATKFRAMAPEFILWDDDTVVYRTETYDFKRGKMEHARAASLVRRFLAEMDRGLTVDCNDLRFAAETDLGIRVEGLSGRRSATLSMYGLYRLTGPHADACGSCARYRPVVALVREMEAYANGADAAMSGLPVEVYLQHRSCGCRDFPGLAAASTSWPLAGPGPALLCKQDGGRLRLDDPDDIRRLAAAIDRKAAVVEDGEIYTCFMRPLLACDPVQSP